MITKEKILLATKCDKKNLDVHYDSLIETLDKYKINTKERISAFLANVIHETGGLKQFEENLKYSAKGLLGTFPKRVTEEDAKKLEYKPEQIANHVYGGRNGNNTSGDGWKFRGRGFFQVTFKNNYEKIGKILDIDLIKNPDLLIKPPYASLSAGIFWEQNKLNTFVDENDFIGLVKKINGGTNGLDHRLKLYEDLLKVM